MGITSTNDVTGWTPIVEGFLSAQSLLLLTELLPEPPVPEVAPPAELKEKGLKAFHTFLMMGPSKAFATNGAGGWGMSMGQFDQELADKKAVENCQKAAQGQARCTVVARGK